MIENDEIETPLEITQAIESPEPEKPRKKKRLKEGDHFYVKNADLLIECTNFRNAYDAWKEAGEIEGDRPRMSPFMGEMLLKIASRAVYAPKYIKFPSIRDEMISEAYTNMIRYGHNFNPNAETRSGYPNPFGYFTQIAGNSFIQRIQAEKRQFLTKAKWVQSENMRDQLEEVFADSGADGETCAATIRMFYNVELPEHSEAPLPEILETVDDDGNLWIKKLDKETGEYEHLEMRPYVPEGLENFFE